MGPPGDQGGGGRTDSAGSCGIGSNRSCSTSRPVPTPHPVPPSPLYSCSISHPNLRPSPFPAAHPASCLALCFAPYLLSCPTPRFAPSPAHCLPSVPSYALPHARPAFCPTSQATKGPSPSWAPFPGSSPPFPRLLISVSAPPAEPLGPGGCRCCPPRAHPSCAAEAGRLLNKLIRSGRGAGAERGPTVGLLEL